MTLALCLIAVAMGSLLAMFFPYRIPEQYLIYTAVALAVMVMCIVRIIKKIIDANGKAWQQLLNFLLTLVVALLMTLFGVKSGIAVGNVLIVVFAIDIFRNLSEITTKILKKKDKSDIIK